MLALLTFVFLLVIITAKVAYDIGISHGTTKYTVCCRTQKTVEQRSSYSPYRSNGGGLD